MTYHLKFRFYFQPYTPAVTPTSPLSEIVPKPASHQNLIRLYWQVGRIRLSTWFRLTHAVSFFLCCLQTEANAGEYDIPKADPGTPPHETIHEITARWQVKLLSSRLIWKLVSFLNIFFSGKRHACWLRHEKGRLLHWKLDSLWRDPPDLRRWTLPRTQLYLNGTLQCRHRKTSLQTRPSLWAVR